jgi:hypothetical protein
MGVGKFRSAFKDEVSNEDSVALLLSRPLSYFARHVKLSVPATIAVVKTNNPHWVRVVGYDLFSLCVIKRWGCDPVMGALISL